MKTNILSVGITVLVGAMGLVAPAAELRPEQIIDKAIRAHGGEERLAGLQGFIFKERTIYSNAATWEFEAAVQLPDRYRSERKMISGGKLTTALTVINGDQGWSKFNDHVTPYPSAIQESMKKYTLPYQGPRSILRLRARQKNPACQFTTIGEETVEGRPAVGLRMKLVGGPEETWFFALDSGLLLKTESRTKRFEGEDQVYVTLYEDYQNYDGFPMARKMLANMDGKHVTTTEYIDFKAVTPSDSTFAKP